MNKRIIISGVIIMLVFSFFGKIFGQTDDYYLLESYSVNFWENENWGRYQNRRYELLEPPFEGRIHLNEPPGWATFDAVWTARDGYNKIKCGWTGENFPGWGTNCDWYIEYMIDIDPFSIGQGCMTEFHLVWQDDPDIHPDFQGQYWFSVDFSLGYFHKYLSKHDSSLVWLCGSDVPGDKYALYTSGYGWTGQPIIVRLWKKERTVYFLAKKETDADFTELYSIPCAINAVLGYVGWSLSCTGEWGCVESQGKPWSGKAKYFRIYTNAELPQYSINFAEADSLGPFMIVPGTESQENYSFTENPGWLRINTEYASGGIVAAKNQLIQPFVPNFMSDFCIAVRVQQEAEEEGQGIGMKLTLLFQSSTKEVVCYWGKGSEALVGYPGGDFFAAGLRGQEILTDAVGVRGPIFLRMVRVGTNLYIDYSMAGSSTVGYRRLATIPNMEGGLLNFMLAAANFGDWGASELTSSIPVDIRSVFIEEKTVDVTPYYTRDNDFNNGLEPFVIPSSQEDAAHYSLTDRSGWLRIETQYHEGELNGAKNALVQTFDETVTSGISVVTRIDFNPKEEGQVFGIQLERISDSDTKNAVLRFGKASTGVTGSSFQKFFEYGFEGETDFVDASSIGTDHILRIERFADRFFFSYSTGSESDYMKLGEIPNAMGSIPSVTIAAANLNDYGATSITASADADVDYFRFGQNSMADGQCEFLNGMMPSKWHLLNIDSTGFSLTERDGWLKVLTGYNDDVQGNPRNGPNAIRGEFLVPHPGIEGDFDFTTLMECSFSEPGQIVEIKLSPGDEDLIIRYGMIGEGATGLTIQAGIDTDLKETAVPNIGPVVVFRFVLHGTTLYFMYADVLTGNWITLSHVEIGYELNPLRYVTVGANNVAVYGATEATSSVPVYIDYFRFNRIDDFLSGVEDKYNGPEGFVLYQNYPNPFNPETLILYQLPKMMNIKLEIYNILGQRVKTLVDKRQMAGQYTVIWDGRNDADFRVASGIYLTMFRAGEVIITRKMILLK